MDTNKTTSFSFTFYSLLASLFFGTLINNLYSTVAYAENAKSFGQHTVYYNAFPTNSLPSQMTQRYQLQRSKNIALVNISVVKNKSSLMPQGVKSIVSGEVKNLMGQAKSLEFKEIHEGEAYYYIAQVRVDNEEVVNFYVNAKPEKTGGNYDVSFSKKFVTK